jgi:hypothetical protein
MLPESTPQMFLQARHELDEIAWAKAVVELVDEDAAPRRRMQLGGIFRRQNASEFRKAGAISAAPTGTVVSISG